MEHSTYSPLRYGTPVTTPLGPAIVIARMETDTGERVQVCFSRSEFSPQQWAQLCPSNAPCTYRQYDRSELK